MLPCLLSGCEGTGGILFKTDASSSSHIPGLDGSQGFTLSGLYGLGLYGWVVCSTALWVKMFRTL